MQMRRTNQVKPQKSLFTSPSKRSWWASGREASVSLEGKFSLLETICLDVLEVHGFMRRSSKMRAGMSTLRINWIIPFSFIMKSSPSYTFYLSLLPRFFLSHLLHLPTALPWQFPVPLLSNPLKIPAPMCPSLFNVNGSTTSDVGAWVSCMTPPLTSSLTWNGSLWFSMRWKEVCAKLNKSATFPCL